MLSPFRMACRDFILPEPASYVFFYAIFNLRNLFYLINGLDAELDDELGYSRYDYKNKDTYNSRNGHSSKTLCTSFGDVEISVPRDRKGEFEPHVLKKNQTSISQDIEEKILSMYAKGMTTSDIEDPYSGDLRRRGI